MSQRVRIKPGRASLIGGIAVAVASVALWVAAVVELGVASAPVVIVGVVLAVGIGGWIRLADL